MFNQIIGPTILFITIGYLLGSISTATIVAKLRGINIKEIGSGNAGATNVTRALGKKLGAITLLLDQFKTILTALICSLFAAKYGWDAPGMIQAGAFAAIIGHIFPVFYKFKGGKGAACISGFLLTMNFTLYPIGYVIFIATMFATRKVSIASIFSITSLVFLYLVYHFIGANIAELSWFYPLDQEFETFYFGLAAVALTFWTHRENIKRIIEGTEREIGSSKK